MPRDGTKNLVPTSKRTKEEQKEIAKKGGIASGKARAEKKLLKECIQALLDSKIKDKSGKEVTGAEAVTAKLFQKALQGDIKAFEVLRDTAGQSPKVQLSESDEGVEIINDI